MLTDKDTEISIKPLSNDLIERIHFWAPPVSGLEPGKRRCGSDLRIGVIVDERLFQGFRYEANIVLLTPDNYKTEASRGKLDFVIIESCRVSVTGHWTHAQSTHNQHNIELKKLIERVKEQNIPIAHWFTHDHSYHEQYLDTLALFDHVFCADPLETDLLQALEIPSSTLLPAIQPIVHHPFKKYQKGESYEIEVIYDGWADVLRFNPELLPIDQLDAFDLKIIDSRNLIFKEKLNDTKLNRSLILGCVDRFDRLTTLRSAKAVISFETSLATPTLQRWLMLETLACRVPQVHLGKLAKYDACKKLILETACVEDFQMELARLIEEPVYRERIAQKAWREVHLKHTFKERLKEICMMLGIEYEVTKPPVVTIITPSNRPAKIQKVIETYQNQKYTEKELIVVFNGRSDEVSGVRRVIKEADDSSVHLIYQPMELYAGACLNIGAQSAKGDFCFRMDDDDHYSPYFVSDTMLHLKAIDADIFGKPPCHLFFEDEQQVYARNTVTPALTKLPRNLLRNMYLRLGGNALAGKTKVFRDQGYLEASFSAADSSFLIEAAQQDFQFYSLDMSNVVASRRGDNSHTWVRSNGELKKNSTLLAGQTIIDLIGNEQPGERTISTVKKSASGLPVVLFLGPSAYHEDIWRNRVKYIFPDLFQSLCEQAEVHLLTGPIPQFAVEGVNQLGKEFGVVIHGLPDRGDNEKYGWWISKGLKYARKIDATIISNIFGGVMHGYAAAKIARKICAKSVIRVAGDEIESALSRGRFDRKSKQHQSELRKAHIAFNRADVILAMSDREKKRIERFCANKNKVHVCNRGVDLTKFLSQKNRFKQKLNTFLYVGRKSREKGYDILEAAAKKLEKSHPDIKFLIAGNFKQETIGNRRYLGFVKTEDLPALYDKANAFVLCSRTEGMPQVVMEAMAKGLPCIVSRHLFEKQLEDHRDVLLVDIDVEDLVRKVIMVHQDRNFAIRLGENARQYAEENFDGTQASVQYKNLVLGITGDVLPDLRSR